MVIKRSNGITAILIVATLLSMIFIPSLTKAEEWEVDTSPNLWSRIKDRFAEDWADFKSFFTGVSLYKNSKGQYVYKNRNFGLEITGPPGWYVRSEREIHKMVERRMISQGIMVAFTKHPPKVEIYGLFEPVIHLVWKYLSSPITLSEFVRNFAYSLSMQPDANDIFHEGPMEIVLNGKRGLMLISEMTFRMTGARIKSIKYFFMKDNTVLMLEAVDEVRSFEVNRQGFEAAINSFKLRQG